MRASGILLPVSSLPSKYGIGCFSKSAFEWIDFLQESGQTFWQILPLGPTSYGDSPYQSFSTFAGNPYFISLEELIEEGLLTRAECESAQLGTNPSYVDYEKQYENRNPLLHKAYENSKKREDAEFLKFEEEQKEWLPDYALFMALKDVHDKQAWNTWEKELIQKEPEVLAKYREELADEICYYEYLQYWFLKQWLKVKKYANERGIKIIGDIPIYVAFDSADAWMNPELFEFDEDMNPIEVAGCPPDGFTADGQLWGNPIYDWEYHKKQNFAWWIRRIKHCEVPECSSYLPYCRLSLRSSVPVPAEMSRSRYHPPEETGKQSAERHRFLAACLQINNQGRPIQHHSRTVLRFLR